MRLAMVRAHTPAGIIDYAPGQLIEGLVIGMVWTNEQETNQPWQNYAVGIKDAQEQEARK